MGNEQSNKKQKPMKSSSLQINPEDISKIKKLTNNKDSLTKNEIFDLWTLEIRDSLLNMYLKYYFPTNSANAIDLNKFISLYYVLNGNNIDKKIELLQNIIRNYDDALVYAKSLLESALFIYKNKECLDLWSNLHINNDEVHLNILSKYLVLDLDKNDKETSFDSLQCWLTNTHELTYLHKYVLCNIFNYKTNQTIIPVPAYNPNCNNTFLDYYYLIFLNLNLMPEYQKQWRLLFTSQFDGESYTKLLSCIINQGPLLVIIEDEESNVFGAFASTNLTCNAKFFGDQNSFLFTIKPEIQVFNSTGFNDNFIYLNCNQQTLPNGLGFGGQFDYWGLWIDSEYGHGQCNHSCSTFQNYKMMSSSKKFKILNIEIWAVGIPPPSAAERGERSVLDADPTASAILELAGKTKHSAGLREPDLDIEEN